MKKMMGIATVAFMMGVVVFCVVASWVSAKYLGPDNYIEEDLEQVAEDEVEALVVVKKGSLKDEVDELFPHKPRG